MIEEVPWSVFLKRFRWKQGEHMTVIGPTGSGKTVLSLELLKFSGRKHVVVLACKPRDPRLSALKGDGFRILREWQPTPLDTKVVLWPKLVGPEDIANQRVVFKNCLTGVYRSGGWCVFCDEVRYLTEYLKLKPMVEVIWQHGRSLGVSLIAATQRPTHIPLLAFDQASHLFFFRDNDEVNLRRMSGLGSANAREVKETVCQLAHHEVLYVNTRTGESLRTYPVLT